MKSVRLIISGVVQGVGYRDWIRKKAVELGITGWVRNREDGSVELLGEGTESDLKEFIAYSKIGPPSGQVDQVDQEWSKSTGQFSEFQVKK